MVSTALIAAFFCATLKAVPPPAPETVEVLYLTAREALDDDRSPPSECLPPGICIRVAIEVETPEGKRWRREWAVGRTLVTDTPLAELPSDE